jgi:Fis family transcriptional regulator
MPATMHYQKQHSQTTALPLSDQIAKALHTYFENMGDQTPENLYQLVMTEVELPLLQAVMQYTNNNQSLAAKILGINRGTFRKKLAFYGML